MKIKAIIVDDDQGCIGALKVCLKDFPYIHVIGDLNNAKETIEFLNDHPTDLVFLDIEMADTNGIELAIQLQNNYPDMMVIFVTGHPGFALQGYEVYPVDFLTKPVNVDRLQKSLKKVLERLSEKKININEKIGLDTIGGIHIIKINDIRYIEKRGRKIFVNCHNGESFVSKDTMKNLESILEPFDFYRSHQSFIVPIKQISGILPDEFSRSYTIFMDDNQTSIPLSRNYYHELKEKLELEVRRVTIK